MNITRRVSRAAMLAAACASVFAVTIIPAAANAGTVSPQDGQSPCGFGASSGNVLTCMHIVSFGTNITFSVATADVKLVGRTIQECVRGPQGTIGCTPFKFVDVGQSLPERGQVGNVPAGDYCANTWRMNNDGSHTEIGHECAPIPKPSTN